jgi:two-component system alkaline phosphatase synthesis response regulator PhoP
MPDQQKTILLADDDTVICEMYRERMLAAGFNVVEAHDGEEAIDQAKTHHPDLILLDIMMPKINGLDALSELKRDEETKHTPVIILTALPSEAEKVKQITTDFVDYVVKANTTPGDVVDKINAQLGIIK